MTEPLMSVGNKPIRRKRKPKAAYNKITSVGRKRLVARNVVDRQVGGSLADKRSYGRRSRIGGGTNITGYKKQQIHSMAKGAGIQSKIRVGTYDNGKPKYMALDKGTLEKALIHSGHHFTSSEVRVKYGGTHGSRGGTYRKKGLKTWDQKFS